MREKWSGFLGDSVVPAPEQRVHMDEPDASARIAGSLLALGRRNLRASREIVLVCIGTDRSTGDALGPLIGSYLMEQPSTNCTILGTLDNPVHATNLADTMDWVNRAYHDPLVIAVDASLGRAESVGYLTVGTGSLKPGAAVNKALPEVGQIYVTGVVNVGGFMEFLVLQNTRLSLVYRMARVAADGIYQGLCALTEPRPVPCSAPN